MNQLVNWIDGSWSAPDDGQFADVVNPASGDSLTQVPLSTAADVARAVASAGQAFPAWRATPVTERVQFLFRFKALLEENLDRLARTVTNECGKTYAEAAGELRRGIENVEVACGMPSPLRRNQHQSTPLSLFLKIMKATTTPEYLLPRVR